MESDLKELITICESYCYWFEHYGNNGMTIQQQRYKEMKKKLSELKPKYFNLKKY